MIVFLNGNFLPEAEAVIPINDRGFLLGDGLFETMRVVNGRPFRMAQHLEKKLHLDQPINIHLTSCPNSCAQHYMGDIGLLGAKVNQGGDTVEGYHVVLGGGFGEKQAVAREVFRGVAFNQLPPLLEHVLKIYLGKRNRGESFVDFTRRHSVKELQELFTE